ncbi:MAG: hypothetical protein K8E66_04100 [Phycisphaerales bacterium]|nr:hypothetical protein [Phycisphaerales bacterium]
MSRRRQKETRFTVSAKRPKRLFGQLYWSLITISVGGFIVVKERDESEPSLLWYLALVLIALGLIRLFFWLMYTRLIEQ